MSFKSILLVLATTTLLSGCNLVNIIRMKNANDHLQPNWPAEQSEIALNAHYLGEKPYVEVAINGVEGFVFMIDTGASMSYLFDSPKVKALNVAPGYQLKVGGWGDQEDSPVFQTEVNQLSLAGVDFSAVNMAYLPVTTSLYFLRADEAVYDGILGHDILHHFSWVFDKSTNKISISNKPFVLNGTEQTFEFDTFLSKISIEGTLNFADETQIEQDMIIDTGSRHYLKFASSLIDSHEIKLAKTITAADFGLSGRTVHQRMKLAQLQLGDLAIDNVKANLIGGDFEDDNGVIGSALLNQYIYVIDYHSDKMHLIKRADSQFTTRYNLLGLELRKVRSGEFVVRYLFPDYISDQVDLKEGDLITRIGDRSATDLTQEDWLQIAATKGRYEVCRQRETESCVTLNSKYFVGYSL